MAGVVFRAHLCLVLAQLSTGALVAQSDRGTINGTVTDPNGGVIPNVTIVAKNQETDAPAQTASTPTLSLY
ncbi:MAG: hypothetical protein JWN34_3287 [Bryobacterales bacterium]|nr:hypothetical protein [Bryobacterales bacterium]